MNQNLLQIDSSSSSSAVFHGRDSTLSRIKRTLFTSECHTIYFACHGGAGKSRLIHAHLRKLEPVELGHELGHYLINFYNNVPKYKVSDIRNKTSNINNEEIAFVCNTNDESCQSQTEEGSGNGGGDSGGDEEQGDDDSDPERPQWKAEANKIPEQLISTLLLIAAASIVLLSYILLILFVATHLLKLNGPTLGGLSSILGVQLTFIYTACVHLRGKSASHRRSEKSRSI